MTETMHKILIHLEKMLEIIVDKYPVAYVAMLENINVKRGDWDAATIKAVDDRLAEFEKNNPKFRRKRK